MVKFLLIAFLIGFFYQEVVGDDSDPNAKAIMANILQWKPDKWHTAEAFEGDLDDIPTRFKWSSLNPFRKLKKKITVKRTAECVENQCKACVIINYKETSYPFCTYFSYDPTKSGLQLSLMVKSTEVFSKKLKDRDYCLSFPLLSYLGEACLAYYGTEIKNGNFLTCFEANIKFVKKKFVRAEFGCFGYVDKKIKYFQPVPDDKKQNAILFSLNLPNIYKTVKEAIQNKAKKVDFL